VATSDDGGLAVFRGSWSPLASRSLTVACMAPVAAPAAVGACLQLGRLSQERVNRKGMWALVIVFYARREFISGFYYCVIYAKPAYRLLYNSVISYRDH
jgi:hypothetical protein